MNKNLMTEERKTPFEQEETSDRTRLWEGKPSALTGCEVWGKMRFLFIAANHLLKC